MGSFHSKSLETASNSLNSLFNLDWSTEWSPVVLTFPLLRLPLLALTEVFKNLDPIELFILSQCSRKAANCVHIAGTKTWKLCVEVGEKCIRINKKYRLIITESSIKPTWKYDRELRFLSYQVIGNKLGLRKALSQLRTAFKCPVTSFEHNHWMRSDQCWVSVLEHIIQNQFEPLESFGLCGTFKNEDLEWALQNVKVSRKIYIYLSGMLNFTTDFRPECERFTFVSSGSLRLDFMKFKTCKYLELSLSLTEHDLEMFMKKWKTGSFPNLQYMVIEDMRSQINWIEDILGFRKSDMEQLGVKRRLVIDENLLVECTGGVDIQADNGTKATMQIGRRYSDWFELFVWNN